MTKLRRKNEQSVISFPQKTALLQRFAIVILAILVIAGFVLRNSGFHHNHMLSFDEWLYYRLGLQLKENPLDYNPQQLIGPFEKLNPKPKRPYYLNEPLFKHPPLFPWLISLSYFFKLKPFPYMSAVMVPMLLGVLTIVLVFFFAKMLYDYRVGLLVALFLTFDPIHWLCSEKIWMETTLGLLIFLALFLFFRGFNQRRSLLYCGLVCGLALFTKYTGIIALISLFLFALLYKEELLFKRNFWFVFIIALTIFSPWFLWNYHIYGAAFLEKMLGIQDIGHRGLQRYNIGLLVLSLTIVLLLILRFLAPKWAPSLRGKISSLFKGIRFLLPVSILTGFILMLFHPSFRQTLKNMWVYSYLPSAGDHINMFLKEPWSFYFSRLLELSPLYLFSFIAAIFFSFKDNRKDLLLIFSAFLMMSFFTLWGNYQSRYILPAVPILLILASRLLIWIWDGLKIYPQTLSTKIAKFEFLCIAGYFIIKTINVAIHLALPNQACYF